MEVMLLDRFTILAESERNNLVGQLRAFASVLESEIADSSLASWLWSGARLLHPNIQNWSEITAAEEHALVLFGAISVTDSRMMESAKYFKIQSRVGMTDPSDRVANYVKIKMALLEQWREFLDNAGIVPGGTGIIVSETHRRDYTTDMNVPVDTDPAPDALTLQLLSQGTTDFTIQWSETKITDFSDYKVYVWTQPGLKDVTRMGESSFTGINASATLAGTFDLQQQIATKVIGLTAAMNYWCVVVVTDVNGKVGFSNEIQVSL
jgi:hypothetical protein